jgi:hypothetical protein
MPEAPEPVTIATVTDYAQFIAALRKRIVDLEIALAACRTELRSFGSGLDIQQHQTFN